MNYRDVYFSRVTHLGETTAEHIRNSGIRSFEKWMAESPHTVQNLFVERGIYFDGIILTNKDKEYQKIMFLNISNNIPLLVGDIMVWLLEDGTEERWLLLQEEKKVNGTYRTFNIIRCNYLIKWIDEFGHLQNSWSYIVSSRDDKIKGNYRTWNQLITPQPNKYAEILMPRRVINRSTTFIVENEAWKVIEYDHTSVPGTIYLSLTEDKINMIYDDTVNNIASLDTLARYALVVPPVTQHFNLNEPIEPIFTIMKNGELFTPQSITYISEKPEIVKVVDNQLIGVSNGEVTIRIKINDNNGIVSDLLPLTIAIDNINTEEGYYIEGPDQVRLDQECNYIVRAQNGEIVAVDNATILKVDKNGNILNTEMGIFSYKENKTICVFHANSNNEVGESILSIKINNEETTVTKKVSIIPLW